MADPDSRTERQPRAPSYVDAALPLLVLCVLIAAAIGLFGLSATEGPLQVAMILSAVVAACILLKNGHSWEAIAQAGRNGVASVVSAISILFAVGALIGTWNMSGTIPTMVYYGILLINADWLYLAALLLCGAVSMAIGSSWTTAATIGVGLVGLALMLDMSPAITAGAVVSGAYLGDKLSPISETTILASQLTGSDVYSHLMAQVWTSVPAFAIAIVVFLCIGIFDQGQGAGAGVIASELTALDRLFWISPLNLVPFALLVVLVLRKVPPSLAIMAAALAAGLLAPILQPEAVLRFVNEPGLAPAVAAIKGVWLALASGYDVNSGVAAVDMLLSRGGMSSMLVTIWLILGALILGALLDEFGLLAKLVGPLLERAHSTGQLIATTAMTAFGLNIVAGDQYVALVLPARLYRSEFERRDLDGTMLSRTIADAGTVTSPLVPWNSCGAYMAAVLGVPTLHYLAFSVFNIASPLLTIAYGFLGFRVMRRLPPIHPAEGR